MSTGFSFGAKTSAPPAFGTGSITFGTPSQQQQPQATGFSFGSNVAAPGATPGLFGAPASAPATTTSSLFGTAPTTGLFGTPTATAAAPNLSFGATATSTGTGLSFGLPTSSAAPATGLSFGLPAATTNTSLPFGQNASANITTSASILGQSFGAPASSAAPLFGFGPATTNSGGLTFNLGGPTATTTATSLNFGLGAANVTTSTATGLTPAVTTSAPVGLGGVASANQGKSTAVTTQKEIPPKDQPLPNEILQTVETFKEMVKQQKQHSSDIARCSVRDFRRVEQEIDQLNNQLHEVESQLLKNRQLAEKLKYDTAKTVQNVEMAQRTHDTPAGLQYENTAPLKFFLNLADQFERDMQNLKIQIEAADKYVKNHKNPDALTPQDLAMGMRRLHETFVALAGRLQSVRSQVESQKETYLNLRKHILQDTNNPFDKLTKMPEFQVQNVQNAFIHSPPKVATGPTPFNNLAIRSINAGAQQHTTPPPAYPGPSSSTGTAFGSTFGAPLIGGQQSNSSFFGSTTFGQPSFNNSFQLQKPSTGNKRGKI